MYLCIDEMRKYILISVNKIKLNDIVRHLCICTLILKKKKFHFLLIICIIWGWLYERPSNCNVGVHQIFEHHVHF